MVHWKQDNTRCFAAWLPPPGGLADIESDIHKFTTQISRRKKCSIAFAKFGGGAGVGTELLHDDTRRRRVGGGCGRGHFFPDDVDGGGAATATGY